ncbi:efflux RND transporter periplasmic adaptor subunit [Novipirellula artificiosorum]|uniref:Macrolide export protein MacA n=1 Tax=Novipirellula artificiosorum TaxID=2528016 RepID=A0A5C6DQF5_9BACT|nr:efflux RND transporter periplasmic adaptor subunit [Novipirellula artificiosorum]TWU38404.1 Macrolide export protein MacA [Novipirellula artificiosorum]
MRTLVKLMLLLLVIGGAVAAAYKPVRRYWKERNRVKWETDEIVRGDITRFVTSTGTIQPVLKVSVGSFVSGPIVELNVDFNDDVTEGDIMARIDPRLFIANVQRDEATLTTREAEVERVEGQLQQALNNYKRGQNLRERNEAFLSDREMDALVFEVKTLQAQRKLAKASVLQAQATLDNSKANLQYCEITAPVDGVVIDRKIDPGQTLAAAFQTPELFVVAPDLRKKVHVFASVDEADIGMIQEAKEASRPVEFTVDAHRDELFHGEIEQIRLSSVSTQNVVTYPVLVAASNTDLKLLPGMTASISFAVDSQKDILKIPNASLRFYPENVEWVRSEDRKLLDSSRWASQKEDDENPEAISAGEKADARRRNNQRHVWVVEGEFLRAVEVTTGLTEYRYTELVSGDLKEGDQLVTGQET